MTFAPMVFQSATFISFMVSLRNCCEAPLDAFREGGAMWFTDLTVCDPTYILPVMNGITFLAIIESGAMAQEGGNVDAKQTQMMKTFFRCLAVFMIPVACQMYPALLLHWITANCCSIIQAPLLRTKKVKKFLGIADMPQTETATAAAGIASRVVANQNASISSTPVNLHNGNMRGKGKKGKGKFGKAE
eukprot:CAMPEP_0197858734 /NCGR_PEP_ID=MMETSP1438-20131217/32756_1 /TAXON_ID=1461541 /ORGANISM="Pterosperma sp., Strain CCMP1384" /LENGTH=188 /DNA_ID=CAMNT_0043474989 /DNA_START=25 /DNA_END=589 /DNA_ORIENTATION=-